jgi:hypothetical protein
MSRSMIRQIAHLTFVFVSLIAIALLIITIHDYSRFGAFVAISTVAISLYVIFERPRRA